MFQSNGARVYENTYVPNTSFCYNFSKKNTFGWKLDFEKGGIIKA